jgi:O-antigen/teichoic acid export membrane protein
MNSKSDVRKAIKESAVDTSIAAVINIPLNFALISTAFYLEFTAFQTTIFVTTIFTIIALIRKTYIRLHFDKKYKKTEI